MADPRTPIRAAVIVGVMSADPQPLEFFELRVPAIRRVMPYITPPLDLHVIPFRYRITSNGAEPVRPKCAHARRRSRPRS
jgi:hypothetical protein